MLNHRKIWFFKSKGIFVRRLSEVYLGDYFISLYRKGFCVNGMLDYFYQLILKIVKIKEGIMAICDSLNQCFGIIDIDRSSPDTIYQFSLIEIYRLYRYGADTPRRVHL